MSDWEQILQAAAPEGTRLREARANPRKAQEQLLIAIIRANEGTEFGRYHRFQSIRDLDDYRDRVPVETHASRDADIRRIAAGKSNVRTSAPVVAFEETGGSMAGAKLVPYTQPALAAFRAGALAWMDDLLRHRPRVRTGRLYVSISPATRQRRRTAGGTPIGLESDAAYLGGEVGSALAALSVVPPQTGAIAAVEEWRRTTLKHLLAADDLTLVSVWSPTFLLGLLDAAPAVWPSVAGEVRALRGRLRASTIERALASDPIDWRAIWPRLDTVSAWTHAAASRSARRLAAELGDAWLQGKGLLATEGMVTLPLSEAPYPVPALTSSVLEFVPDGAAGPTSSLFVDEIVADATYRVLLTTPGGFYRYDLGDLVRCRGFFGAVPMLEFVGRAGNLSDLVGEKLNEQFVASRLPPGARVAALLAADRPEAHYVLLLDRADAGKALAWAMLLDEALCDNPQYRYARAVGQLGPVEALVLENADGLLVTLGMRRRRRLGDIKPAVLVRDTDVVDQLRSAPRCGVGRH